MAEAAGKVTVSQPPYDEEELPPPPPPPVPPRPLDYEGPESSSLPLPPPKETFTEIYQQRQKSELKRLFKHIHPDLRAGLDDVVDDDIIKAVRADGASDAAYQGEVQSMKWIFENWNLDNIGDSHATRKLLEEEEPKGGDVRGTSCVFEHINSNQKNLATRQMSVRGDVRTSMWLFETQPLDALNKLKSTEGRELVEAVLKEPIQQGNVQGTRHLFESKPLSDLGRCNSIEDHSFLKLKSELQEQKGDIQKTVKLFQAAPCCAIRDNSGNIHEVKSICREEISSGNISSARWLFETQPLDLINKDSDEVKIIRGISLKECHRGGVDQKRWMFETQSFDTIKEVVGLAEFEGTAMDCAGEADVVNKRKLFETQPLAALKGDSSQEPLGKEDIIGGDVKTSLWLFETQPMDALSDSHEVGRLQKITLAADEQGEVKGKKQIFESCNIEKSPAMKQQEIERGDVKSFKHLFETIPLGKISHSDEEIVESEKKNHAGNVKDNMALFENTPLYAIKDSSGNFHKVTTVSREELISGKVQNYKWMFETKPLDELTDEKGNIEVIQGITRQEDQMGDVKMAKWLFETQTIDKIHASFNQTQQNESKAEEFCKGDVKTCKWLFETQPMDILYEKTNKVNDNTALGEADVKSITWLFESQPLDSIKDGEEYNLKLCRTIQDSVKSEAGVQTVKHIFETEHLDRVKKGTNSEVRRVSQVNFQSGDVSRVKELFESQSLDEIGLEMATTTYKESDRDEHIEKGFVQTFTWMFDNCPIHQINKENKDANLQEVFVTPNSDVQKKKFIFETSSLDKVHAEPLQHVSASAKEVMSNVDVKSSTTMFESLPLYAIRDKEGQFHEVTTVKKEEVMSGDVRGARWMFETKPLDAIKAENEVYVIRAVTQEDVKTGDVQSARWRFETQPLDSFTTREKPSVKVTEDFGTTNVQFNRQIFESEQVSNKFVRMVSVTDVQHGDVRTSTWLFENQTIDSLKGEPHEQGPVKTVHREDSQKGDVKRCTWLFESQPLDKIKECEGASAQGAEEEIPKVDVKCTTWLFETTPLDKISASSVTDTLFYLYERAFIYSSGIIIEENENRNVNMAKYLLESNTGVQIQKEEAVGGNIRNIMFELLVKSTLKPHVHLLKEFEKGKVETTILELPVYRSDTTLDLEKDQTIQKIAKRIDDFLSQNKNMKNGIIIQETAGGQADMTVYSLMCSSDLKIESQDRERGDVKSTIGNLMATANAQKAAVSCVVDQNEKGNVNLYKSCIEKGDLQYLKTLHASSGDEVDQPMAENSIHIIYGDVKEAKRSLCQQKQPVERTISDVLPGDVKKTKQLFSSECLLNVDSGTAREEIIPGDISSAKQQLSVQPPVTIAREDIVAGDIKATLQSLQRAKQQSMSVEREPIKPGTIYDMNLSTQDLDTEASQTQKEAIISGDVKAAKRSLEMAKQQSMSVEREVITPGKIYNLNVAQEEELSELTASSSSPSLRSQRIKTFPKVSDAENNQERNTCFEGFRRCANAAGACAPASLLPFVNCECNGEVREDEGEELIKGDVKAAIRSLQSAAAEQKLLDKEDVVRGNVQLALQSLEKSSVNVSKGDYKAAMIYRNSAKTCSERSKTFNGQSVVVSIPPSDTLSPSISVTCEGQPSVTTENSTPKPVAKGNSMSSTFDSYTAPSPPQKASDKPQKPVLSPKPMWTRSVVVKDPSALSNSVLEATYPLNKNPKNEVTSPPQSQQTTFANKTPEPTTHGEMSKVILYEVQVQEPSQPNELLPTDSMVVKKEQKVEPLNVQTEHHTTTSKSTGIEMEKNVIQKINAADEIRMCRMTHTNDNQLKLDKGMQGEEIKSSKGVRVIEDNDDIYKQNHESKGQQHILYPQEHRNTANTQGPLKCPTLQSDSEKTATKHENKVVLREKRVKETDDERRQRLSVHKEEIMKGNVKETMEIFENMRKREELKGILSQVQEFEGETRSTDVTSLKTLYDNVPVWMVTPSRGVRQCKSEEKKVEIETQDDDMESISSVETAFEDLEKASKEILNLKEQTLAKLLDIEEAIRKALYSVSNLKSEADIAGLSGLFDESLKCEQHSQSSSNIRKISIGSSKTKPDQIKESPGAISDSSPRRDDPPRHVHTKPLVGQSTQSSPSFISIHSAARKPVDQPKPSMSTFKPNAEPDQTVSVTACPNTETSPVQRNVSVLEVKTRPKQAEGIIGTKTVNETYEETDGFGNVFVSSVTSTFFTKQADSKSSTLFEVDGKPTRYGAVSSPLFQRSGHPFQDKMPNNAKDESTVFVTFSQPKK